MRSILLAAALVSLCLPALAKDDAKKQADVAEKRARIDAKAKGLLDKVLAQSPDATKLHGQAFGWAAFDDTKVAIGVSGGGGSGVAVEKAKGTHTYMKMGTVGVGLGLGAQNYEVLFLFENEKAFRSFVDNGWQGGADASAAAGDKGANAAASFHDGIAIFTVTDKGLIANADVSGTKYWKNDKLN
jgi:lipid-binding SYLF domain-containing protein